MSEPNERDKDVAVRLLCFPSDWQVAILSAYREEILAECNAQGVQALMREEAARRELHECRATLELERAEMGRLRAEVERLKQELVDMTHKHRNQCDATDRQTEELAGAEAEIRGLNAELDAERERLRRQNHQAAERRDKESAKDKSDLAKLRALMVEAARLLNPSGDGLGFSMIQQAAVAGLLGKLAKAEAELSTERERLRGLPDRMLEAWNNENPSPWVHVYEQKTARWCVEWLRKEVER
jgi:DNA repair exonuclease SbcCD ATPase subunit